MMTKRELKNLINEMINYKIQKLVEAIKIQKREIDYLKREIDFLKRNKSYNTKEGQNFYNGNNYNPPNYYNNFDVPYEVPSGNWRSPQAYEPDVTRMFDIQKIKEIMDRSYFHNPLQKTIYEQQKNQQQYNPQTNIPNNYNNVVENNIQQQSVNNDSLNENIIKKNINENLAKENNVKTKNSNKKTSKKNEK